MATGKQSLTKQCPVTGGVLLKCTERGFREACAKYRQNLKLQSGTRSEYCATCRGKVPGEVIFVKLKHSKPGVLKAMNEGDKKICFLCGEEKNLKAQYGQEVCSYCQIVRLQAKNRPDVLIKALQELAWKFAEGVISGEVVGVEVEDIRLLRGVQ